MLSTKDLVFKERPVKKLIDQYIGSNIINKIVFTNVVNVIRRECGQTLARVRVSRTYISIIIISLQWT